jgi:hypothetical protein
VCRAALQRCISGPAHLLTGKDHFMEMIVIELVHTLMVAKQKKKSPTKERPHKPAPAITNDLLKGWQQIALFLGQPVSVVQRWAHEGMPVKREGRFVTTSRAELNQWLGRESGEPVHVATPETDLSAELKRGLARARGERPSRKR